MGFEPTVRYKRTQHFQCCALNHLDHLSIECHQKALIYYTMFFEKCKSFFKIFKNFLKKVYRPQILPILGR